MVDYLGGHVDLCHPMVRDKDDVDVVSQVVVVQCVQYSPQHFVHPHYLSTEQEEIKKIFNPSLNTIHVYVFVYKSCQYNFVTEYFIS